MSNGNSQKDVGVAGVSRRPVKVTVTIENDNPPTFDMTSTPPDHLPIKKAGPGADDFLLTFNNNAGNSYSDGFIVTFEIKDKTKNKYGFFFRNSIDEKLRPYDAISVKTTDSEGHCPAPGSKWDGFRPTAVSRNTLTVENPNLHLQYFGFALHFSKDGETEPSLTFDPIGDDQNGHSFTK
jgi:hypothetical protein